MRGGSTAPKLAVPDRKAKRDVEDHRRAHGAHTARNRSGLTSTTSDTQIVALRGVVGLPEARELERGIIAGIAQGRTRVVIDLTDVADVGPGLLGVLLRARRGVSRVGGSLALVVAGPPVSDLVKTTLLATLIPIAGDQREALALVSADTDGPAGDRRPARR